MRIVSTVTLFFSEGQEKIIDNALRRKLATNNIVITELINGTHEMLRATRMLVFITSLLKNIVNNDTVTGIITVKNGGII